MKKNIIRIILLSLLLSTRVNSQIITSVVPDSGYQNTSFPISINGSGTEWHFSPYYEVFFDSVGVTSNNAHMINDTLITATAHVGPKAALGWRRIIVADAFLNNYINDSALYVILSIAAVPTLLRPLNNSINQLQNPTLLWDSNGYATSFRLQLSTDTNFNNIVIDSTLSNTPLVVRPNFLGLGVKYFWRVNATNSLGTSDWSVIWKFTIRETGISVISSEIPSEYMLFNNFPNPFNPSTSIRYSIPYRPPGNTFVTLKIYDVTGKEVAMLVNQNQKPGTYEVTFGANSVSSGIYFYQIQAGSFMQTKKMVLIK
jgi:hypothetical protein